MVRMSVTLVSHRLEKQKFESAHQKPKPGKLSSTEPTIQCLATKAWLLFGLRHKALEGLGPPEIPVTEISNSRKQESTYFTGSWSL